MSQSEMKTPPLACGSGHRGSLIGCRWVRSGWRACFPAAI